MLFRAASIALLPLLSSAASSPSLFSYEPGDEFGPENWANVPVDGTNECGGTKNSPIAVETDACSEFGDYVFTAGTCQSSNFGYSINDHVVGVAFTDCSPYTMQVPGVETVYNALQFHIHTSSEHTIDGANFPAELHIVHQDANNAGAYAVAGMMITPDNPSNHEIFEIFLDGWEAVAEATAATCEDQTNSSTTTSLGGRSLQESDVNIYDLIPDDASFYVYSGGLTTPPCSQVVAWNLADKPVQISVRQFSRLMNLVLGYLDSTCTKATIASSTGSTSRPPVALNGRTVGPICPESQRSSQVTEGSAASFIGASAVAAATVAAVFAL